MDSRREVAPSTFLTVREAITVLPIGRSTLYALIESGQLPHYRVSAAGGGRGRILVALSDLHAFIERARDTRPVTPVRVDVDDVLRRVRRA